MFQNDFWPPKSDRNDSFVVYGIQDCLEVVGERLQHEQQTNVNCSVVSCKQSFLSLL